MSTVGKAVPANIDAQEALFVESGVEIGRDRVLDSRASHTVVIDARTLFRDLLVDRLVENDELSYVRAFATVRDFLGQYDRTRMAPLIILGADSQASISHCLEMLVQSLASHARIVVVADTENVDVVRGVLHAGAHGYIPASLPMIVVLEAIKLVRAGGVYIPPSCLSKDPWATVRMQRLSGGSTSISLMGQVLSNREAAVTEALLEGKSNKIIGLNLAMAESTVKVHVRNIMRKLKARNRTEVAYMVNRYMSEHS